MIDLNKFLISIVMGVLIAWFLSGLVIMLHADTYTYLVNMSNFPQGRYWSSGLSTAKTYTNFTDAGLKQSRQPFENTRFETNYNKKYGLLNVTLDTTAEKKSFASMKKQKHIKLLSINAVDYIFDRQKGGYELIPRSKTISELPSDFYELKVSTK
ncbi:MAG: hypothetical protein M0Q46_06165 [Endomicrobiales bacterium]|nr:hypothetical protein [Endomicrobiales bacterium]